MLKERPQRAQGHLGHLVWSFSGYDGVGGREEVAEGMQAVATQRLEILPNTTE